MADNLLLEEARRRGLVPSVPSSTVDPGLLDEAQRRGLASGGGARLPYAPIPDPIKPELVPERPSLWNRDTAVMLGASAGGVIPGMVAGGTAGLAGGLAAPVTAPLGALAGGILGAGAGSLLYDLTQDAPEIVEATKQGRIGEASSVLETSQRALSEMGKEAKWGGGTMAAGPVLNRLGKPLVGKLMGVLNPEARRITDLGHAQGIDLAASHVSPRKLVKGLPRVLGVFPFVGSPYRKGQARVVGQLDERAADLLNTLAPASTRYDVAKGLTEAAVKRYGKYDRVASVLYNRFYKIADDLPVKDIVPTQPLKEELAEVARREGIEQITLQSGESFKAFGTDAIGDWLRQVSGMSEHITIEQARGLERQLNAILRTGAKEGWDVSRLSGMKQALQESKATLDISRLSPGDAQRVIGAWQQANEFFAETRRVFETGTARRFGRVDKNIFRKGVFKPGTTNQDQIFESVFQAKSPEALSDLRRLVGPGEFSKASRKFLDTAFNAARVPAKEGALVEDMFSAAKFEKRLGLDTKEGWDALGEMLKGSDVTVKDWQNFLEVAKKATDITIRDPSTFVMRRFVLGAGLAGSVAMGAGQVSIPAAVFVSYVARSGAKFMMNKNQLRRMTRVLDDTTSDHLRRMLVTRFLRIAAADEREKPKKSNTRPRPPGRQ